MERENKMGTMPVPKLVVNMSQPIMVSMLVQSMYNIVDSVFVARISEDALTAASIAYSAQMLQIAVAVGTGVGMNPQAGGEAVPGGQRGGHHRSGAVHPQLPAVCAVGRFRHEGVHPAIQPG